MMKPFCHKFLHGLIWSTVLIGCIEPFPPPVIDVEVDFLVVDGFLDSSSGTVSVSLARAIPLSSKEPFPVENANQVILEDNAGNVFPLTPEGNGKYSRTGLIVDASKEYRIYIRRSNAAEYRSAFIPVKSTPLIDSVTWSPTALRDGIEIQVNTHDDTGASRYYLWSYEETYQYQAAFYSAVMYENNMVRDRAPGEIIFQCWRTIPSTNIIIGSSERLATDVISKFPVKFLPVGSQELIIKYSILIKQRSLTREAYDYWINLQKTTENLGSLFDPQPGQVTGNIENIADENEPVLGYFDVGEVHQQRLFIGSDELPDELKSLRNIGSCTLDTVSVAEVGGVGANSSLVLLSGLTSQNSEAIIAYLYTRLSCADCRLQGGVTTKPSFWE